MSGLDVVSLVVGLDFVVLEVSLDVVVLVVVGLDVVGFDVRLGCHCLSDQLECRRLGSCWLRCCRLVFGNKNLWWETMSTNIDKIDKSRKK